MDENVKNSLNKLGKLIDALLGNETGNGVEESATSWIKASNEEKPVNSARLQAMTGRINSINTVITDEGKQFLKADDSGGYSYDVNKAKGYLEGLKGKNWADYFRKLTIGSDKNTPEAYAYISAIQIGLNNIEANKNDKIVVDGLLGPKTASKLAELQKRNGDNKPNGYQAGPKTIGRLLGELSNNSVSEYNVVIGDTDGSTPDSNTDVRGFSSDQSPDTTDRALEGRWHIDQNLEIVFDDSTEIKIDDQGKKYIENNGSQYYEYKDGMDGLGYEFGIYAHEGRLYVGNFENGKFNGNGTMTWSNGDKYEGEWKNGVREGYGITILANRDYYEGNYVNNKKVGQGKITWTNGNVYEGSFEEDKMYNGRFFLKDPENIAGVYNVLRDDKGLKILGGEHNGEYLDTVTWEFTNNS